MVSANGGTVTKLKARFGNDVRRKSIHHANDLTLNDLVLMLQRVFSITSSDIQLKYRDSEGDFITIADDADLLEALHESSLLFIDVLVGGDSSAADLFQQIQKVREDIDKLSGLANALVAAQGEKAVSVVKTQNWQHPSSPVPTEEKSEVPATIQPSHHEEVNSHYDQVITSSSDVSAPFEQEIPLEADGHDSFASHVPDPHMQHHHYQPPSAASIPQFPQSNVPAPIQPEPHYGVPGGVPGVPPMVPHAQPLQQQQQPPTPHSSVSSTPIPQQFGHPGFQQFQGGMPPQQQQHVPPQHGGFVPPPQGMPSAMGGQFPPQGFAPPPAPQQQQPPQMSAPLPPQGQPSFAPPPQMGAPPPQFAPPSEPAPPQHPGMPQFAPPPTFGHPQQQQQFNAPAGQFAPPPPQMGAPPQMSGPPMGAPPMGGPPPMGAPPMGGMPGQNPFARGPGGPPGGYRQSPYHQ